MAGFYVIADINDRPMRKLPVSSLTASIGDLLELTAGSTTWAKCTSTSNFFTRKAIVMEAITSASTVLAQELDGNEEVVCDATETAATTDNGDRMTLTDENEVNNTHTDVTGQAVSFVQTGIVGTTKVKGYVLVGSGVDPDAA